MRHFGLCVLVLALSPLGAFAQAPSGEAPTRSAAPDPVEQRVQQSMDEFRKAPPGHLREEPWSMSVAELELELQPLRTDALKARVDAWLELINVQIAERNHAQVGIERALKAGATADAGVDQALVAAFTARRELAKERIQLLVERLNVGLDLVERRGDSVVAERAYLSAIRSPRASEQKAAEEDAKRQAEAALTEEERLHAAKAEAIAKAVEGVQRDLPVHERPDPWTIPVRELELELQPLQTAEIKERADIWAGLLEQKVRERNRLLLAADRPDNAEISADLTAKATDAEAVIQAIVERMEVLLRMMEKRGDDPSGYRQYITDVTGIKLNLTDFDVLGKQAWAWTISEAGGIRWATRILGFLATLLVFWYASKLIGRGVGAAMTRLNKDVSPMLRDVFAGVVRNIVMIVGVVVSLGVLGVNITPLVAALGAAGLVIGLALQGTLSNFASGLLILMNKPFDVGDVVSAGGVTGKVDGLSLVSTRIMTFDNQAMYVPNNQVWNGVITNLTGQTTRRVDLVFGIAYKDDIGTAEAIISDIVSKHPKALKDPAPVIKVHELGESSVNFIVRPWAATGDYWDVYWDITRQVKERFDAEGVGIPFPQRDLHVPGQIEVVLAERRAAETPIPKAAVRTAPVTTGSARGEPGPADQSDDEAEPA